jgi:cation diffusion facilitator family transporter
MGHGRFEYLGESVIAIIISYIGFAALWESIQKIIHPEETNYTVATVIVVLVAIAVKVLLGLYVKNIGQKTDSDMLKNSGQDALFDSLISAGTLVAIIVSFVWHISIEPYLAAVISIIIIRSAIKMIVDAFSVILGERVDHKTSTAIKRSISEIDGVEGAYDLIFHDYGHDRTFASVNIEVPSTITASEIDDLSRVIRKKIYSKYHVLIASGGIYSINTKDKDSRDAYHKVRNMLAKYEHVDSFHGFKLNKAEKEISFDVVVTFGDTKNYYHRIIDDLKELFPDYKFNISIDLDFSD